MKLYQVLVAAALLALCSGCKFKPGCIIEEKVVNAVSGALASGLQCNRPDLVKQDVGALVGKLGLCKKEELKTAGPVGAIVCGMLADFVVDKLADVAIPKRWECSAANASATAKAIVTTTCTAILPF